MIDTKSQQDGDMRAAAERAHEAATILGYGPEGDERYQDELDAICDTLYDLEAVIRQAATAAAVGDGYVVVPREPTHDMLRAAEKSFSIGGLWKSMLAAAPKAAHGGE